MDAIVPLAKHLIERNFADIPLEVIQATKKSILDTLAGILAGSSALGCPEIVRQAIHWGGREESTIINYRQKVPVFLAALANGTMARAVDFDDVFEPGTLHASTSIVPTAFAVAEMKEGIDGRQFLNAVALGIDMICRMASANRIPPGVSGMNATFQCAYFGCAGVAGKIMGLDEEKMIHAMGLAYSQTSGNSENLVEGTLATRFCQGLAAQGGVYSAIFSHKGVTAAKEVLEGKFGYYPVYQGGEYDRKKLLDGLGEDFQGVNLTTKRYPCCMHTHAAIEGVLKIAREFHLQSSDVEKITVKVNQQGFNFVCSPMEKKRTPRTIPEAQFSLPYVVATALVKGKVFFEDFTAEEIQNPYVLRIASKIDCLVDSGLEKIAQGGVTPAVVEVTTKRGECLSQQVNDRKGSPKNPMNMDEIADKFRRCTDFARQPVPEQNTKEIIALVKEIETLDDVTQILKLL